MGAGTCKPSLWVLAAAAITAATAAAAADEPPAATPHVRWGLDPDAPSYFRQGTFQLDLAGGYVRDWDRSNSYLVPLTVGASYFIDNTLALRAAATGYYASQENYDASAVGLSLGFHHHFLNSGNWSVFGEVSGGLFYASHRIPEGGTHFNLTLTSGLGATYRLDDHLHLLTGVRYFHLSNAAIEGRDRNPSVNGWGAYLGLVWSF